MTLCLYDDTTHQVVPKEPVEKQIRSGGASHDHPSVYMGGPSQHGMRLARRMYTSMLTSAPPHGAALPTREEISRVIARADYGYEVEPAKWRYEAADAILALIQERMKP